MVPALGSVPNSGNMPYNSSLGTSGHRGSGYLNYNYDDRNIPPTSTHYLPPPSQPVSNMIQPTMVGLVPPPPMVQNAHLIQPPQHPFTQNYLMQMAQVQAQYQPAPPYPQQFHPSAPAPVPQQQQQQQQPTVGGINSVLEYELKSMTTFLSWCAFGMLKQNRNPTSEFESLVHSVLFATRLPKSTIIIALEYMNQRFSSKELEEMPESDIFIKLIVSLILGNKFNDDNTFTNRSWCGATGLQINILNDEEKDWLKEIKWQLNVVNFESNIVTLEECWKTWLDKYNTEDVQSSPISHSIPSSPLTDYNYYSSPITSPKYPDSIWSNGNVNYQPLPSHQNIWSFTPNFQYNQPQYLNSNFVGYANPYYTFNMASC